MSREIDARDFAVNRIRSEKETQLRSLSLEVSEKLVGAHQVKINSLDATTGNVRAVASESALAEKGNYIQRALNHVHNISSVLGFTPTQPVEFIADPHIQETTSGAVAVHLQQLYKGIPIFQAAQTVRFEPNGALKETIGTSITVDSEVSVQPKLSAQEAVVIAAKHVAVPHEDELGATDQFGEPLNPPSVNVDGFEPNVIATFPEKPEQLTLLDSGPFGDRIKARLVWFPLADKLRLAWEVVIAMPDYAEQYRTMVDTEMGEILYCHQLVQYVLARGNIFRTDGGGVREMRNFPESLEIFDRPTPSNLPSGFPDDWVDLNSTEGNCVRTHMGTTVAAGTVQNGVLTFNPANAGGNDQLLLNLFYFNCIMHDFFYLCGFREADGNFQQNNFGRGGVATDRVDARVHPGQLDGTAYMKTSTDGNSPEMNMGLVTATNRHTALDSSVVFHEFTHGVTNRLVGGPADVWALESDQSMGMGEGWSDYFPCIINNTNVVGAWVTNNPDGIRKYPYDSNFPDNFGDLGTGRYTGYNSKGKRWPHPIGEIWCATLMEMTRNIGKTLAAQLVVDALKLSPTNPSFLDIRDAVLSALDDKLAAGQLSHGAYSYALNNIWLAFAKFGMGPSAKSNGASLKGIKPDFSVPAPKAVLPVEILCAAITG